MGRGLLKRRRVAGGLEKEPSTEVGRAAFVALQVRSQGSMYSYVQRISWPHQEEARFGIWHHFWGPTYGLETPVGMRLVGKFGSLFNAVSSTSSTVRFFLAKSGACACP